MPERLVTVATFDSQPEAALAMSLLESHGIECVLLDEHMVRLSGPLAAAVGGIKLQVRESDAWSAQEVLTPPETEKSMGSPEARAVMEPGPPQCPECLSRDVGSTGGMAALLVLLGWIGGVHSLANRRWRCRSCGHDWRM